MNSILIQILNHHIEESLERLKDATLSDAIRVEIQKKILDLAKARNHFLKIT